MRLHVSKQEMREEKKYDRKKPCSLIVMHRQRKSDASHTKGHDCRRVANKAIILVNSLPLFLFHDDQTKSFNKFNFQLNNQLIFTTFLMEDLVQQFYLRHHVNRLIKSSAQDAINIGFSDRDYGSVDIDCLLAKFQVSQVKETVSYDLRTYRVDSLSGR